MPRLIHESINCSKKLSRLSPHAFSLFCLLIPKFNSHGKMNGNVHFIKGEVCSHFEWLTIPIIEQCLKEISKHTNVKWWKDENDNYWIHALNFEKYQSGIRKKGNDKFPNYHFKNEGLEHDKSSTTPVVVQDKCAPEVRSMKYEVRSTPLPPKKRGNVCGSDFEKFWTAYPRKQNRGRAEKAWQSLAPSEPLTVQILQAVEEAKTSEDWRKEGGQFIPHPSSWLNAKGWLDEGLDLKALNTSTGPPKPVVSSSSELPTPPTDEEREASLQAMREAKKNLPWADLGGGDSTLPKQKVEAEKPPEEPIIPVRSLDGLINGLTGKLSMTG